MSKTYVGVSDVARQVNGIYVGVNNVARKVLWAYAGDENNVARKVYQSGNEVSIPTMTSNTAPSGTASASSIQSNDYPAWKAFDKNENTFWASLLYGSDHNRWVQYDFGYLVLPLSIKVKNYSSNNNAWSFVIEASTAGSSWDTLVDCSSNTAQVNTTYQISTSTMYRYYRYRCTNGANTYRAGVYEFNVTGIS